MIRTVLTPTLSPDVTVVPTSQIVSHLVESSVEGRAGVDVQGLEIWEIWEIWELCHALVAERSPTVSFGRLEAVWDLSLLSLRRDASRSVSITNPKSTAVFGTDRTAQVSWSRLRQIQWARIAQLESILGSLPNPSWYCRSYPWKQLVSGLLFARRPLISALNGLHSSIIVIVLHVKLVQHLETFASKQQTECQPKECHLPYLQTGHDGFPTDSHGFTWSLSCQAALASSGPECSPRILRKSCSKKRRQDGKQRENSELNICMFHHGSSYCNTFQ